MSSIGWTKCGCVNLSVLFPIQALERERLLNFHQLCQLDEEALVPNHEAMECRICYLDVGPGEGVLLRECLHSFCR